MGRETKKGRGGAPPGAGRKPLPPHAKRSERVRINLTPAERRDLERAAGDEPLAEVLRRLVLRWLARRRPRR